MTAVADFGVTPDGFVVKPVDVILSESLARANAVFGDADLTSTSVLRKLLETTAAEDGELWKRLEDLYYGNFVSTAVGDDLTQLGEDVGVARSSLVSTGTVRFTLANAAPGRRYVLPEGTIVVTGPDPVRAYGTTASVTIDSAPVNVGVVAFEPGPLGDVLAGKIVDIDPTYRATFLADFGTAKLTVTNPAPTTGGAALEADGPYRAKLLGLARNLWTPEAVAQAALRVSGVVDVVLSDPLGGVDVSQSYFDLFTFDQRAFSSERRVGEPYFFTVVVAHEFRAPWRTIGPVQGIFERVTAAVDQVRPIGVHANIVEADHIEVGLRATVVVQPGSDGAALLASVRQRLAGDIGGLRLGGDVRYSQVVRAFVEQPGVLDVQGLHLRRSPAAFGRITFGDVGFQQVLAEAAVGENLVMGPTELAIFAASGEALEVTLVTG
ncbi:baseplate J/gp47 family protein [Amycolatopsis sp. RTGN1]|uniref:baseplate J/gp47 family protein n=1 Tax=Amycolatopsis ponsaeliensis TaxID=2992142 RepID=UPI002551B9B9|nr:baseplate J/gp47 family protein [Amycolatopsis sp. RTGN1]